MNEILCAGVTVTAALVPFESRTMSRGRSPSPRTLENTNGSDIEMRGASPLPHDGRDNDFKVVIVSNLTRSVVEVHLRTIFSFYGDIRKIDIPLFAKCEISYGLKDTITYIVSI